MNYTQIPETYKYRYIADAVYARELEYFSYDFDRINFEHMIENLPDGELKDDLVGRHKNVLEQMQSVKFVLAALWAQVDDANAYAQAVEYVTQERERKELQGGGE